MIQLVFCFEHMASRCCSLRVDPLDCCGGGLVKWFLFFCEKGGEQMRIYTFDIMLKAKLLN